MKKFEKPVLGRPSWVRQKPGSSAHLPKRTGCTLWFFRISAGTKLNCAFNNSGLNSNFLHFSMATFTQEEFPQSRL